MRLACAAGLAGLALAASACASDDDEGGGGAETNNVTTTRVEVVTGIGRSGGFDPGQIYERLSPGVVTVLSIFEGGALPDADGEGGQGSGFVIDGRGYVATNAHVITTGESFERAERVFVEFSDGNRVPAEIVGVDPNSDVALLKLDAGGLGLTPLQLGRTRDITVGEPVAAIGSPFGEPQSLTIGVVSALDRNIESLTRFAIGNAVQTDAAINPGNSGGPLLDARGRVIGINAQIKTASGGGEGVGFAIPVDTVRRSLDELRAEGEVSYGYLGVSTLVLWPQAAERLGLGVQDGAVVQDVEVGSPAEDAGLKAGTGEVEFQSTPVPTGGDVIVAVDGRRLTRRSDLADVISAKSSGERVKLEVLRDGERRTVEVELGERPAGSG